MDKLTVWNNSRISSDNKIFLTSFVVFIYIALSLSACSRNSDQMSSILETPTQINYQVFTPTSTQSYAPSPSQTDPIVQSTETASSIVPLLAITMDFDSFGSNSPHVIYTIRADGTELNRLVDEPVYTCCPSWSPDGRWIAFLGSNQDAMFYQLYILEYETGVVHLIPTEHVGRFTWAPDSQRMSYTEEVTNQDYYQNYYPSKINIVNLSDWQPHLLYDASWQVADIAWSPTIDIILVISSERGMRTPYFLDLESNIRQLQTSQRFGFQFSWHPSGLQIAFDSAFTTLQDRRNISVIDIDGTNEYVLIQMNEDSFSPQWSPDGETIAYSNSLFGSPNIVRFTNINTGRTWTVSHRNVSSDGPTWSPNGEYLAYISQSNDVSESGYSLVIYSLEDRIATTIVNEFLTASGISWRPIP